MTFAIRLGKIYLHLNSEAMMENPLGPYWTFPQRQLELLGHTVRSHGLDKLPEIRVFETSMGRLESYFGKDNMPTPAIYNEDNIDIFQSICQKQLNEGGHGNSWISSRHYVISSLTIAIANLLFEKKYGWVGKLAWIDTRTQHLYCMWMDRWITRYALKHYEQTFLALLDYY